MSRRQSETYEKMPNKQSTLEKNCGQIFSMGPTLTRDILQKMERNRTQILGYDFETRQFWLLAGLVVLFVLSCSTMIAMWFTEAFDNIVFSKLALVPGTQSYEMWANPSPKPLLKVHIFNYTNVEEYKSKKAEKLNVKELGPYVYEMTLSRVNTKFESDQVTYQEHRSFKFISELSQTRRQNDQVVVPNIPLFTVAALNRHSSYFTRATVSGLLNTINADPFLTLPAHRFIIGYEDNLYSFAKSYMKFQNQKPYEQFGLVSRTNGLGSDVITVNTGAEDINKIGFIRKFNDEESLHHWSTSECNNINDATDGNLFSPKTIRNKRPVHYYLKDMCRTLPLHFNKEVKILNGNIPAYRYTLPDNVYDSAERTSSNQCFCDLDSGECPRQGVFNATPCAFGAPVFVSFPHFYNSDPELKKGVTGLNPNPDYKTYADIHPTLGFVMAGKTRMQINVQVFRPFGISQMSMFDDDLMLPVALIEVSMEDKRLPEDVVGLIFQTTFTLRSIELGLKYGSLLTMAVTLFGILLVLKNRWAERIRTNSIRPIMREAQV